MQQHNAIVIETIALWRQFDLTYFTATMEPEIIGILDVKGVGMQLFLILHFLWTTYRPPPNSVRRSSMVIPTWKQSYNREDIDVWIR